MRVKSKYKKIEIQNTLGYVISNGLMAVLVLLGCFVMLEYSCIYGFSEIIDFINNLNFVYILLNFSVLGLIWSVIALVSANIWFSCLIMAIACGIISVINHYVLLFHGMPLSFLLIKNLSTAMNVMSGYAITLDACVIRFAVITAFLVVICLLFRLFFQFPTMGKKKRLFVHFITTAVFCVSFYVCFLGENPVKPAKTISWSWTEGYGKYGYAACSVESFFQMWNVVNKPDGYSQDAVSRLEFEGNQQNSTQTPDVILILNESLYDLKQITDIETNDPYLQNVYALDNIITGYAVIPSIGGGTNSSEYELLTSNSLELMPGITPFNALDMEGANSVVSYLNVLGYSSIACHSAVPGNYARGIGYPGLGFDKSFFIEDYIDLENYYNRAYTDESTYNNLIRWYEEMPEDTPRFMYALTYQNHGAYDQNDPEADTIHVRNDFGEYTQLINEFLTSISLSDQAFCRLTEYFATVNRPVIVCMVGDHSPNFAPAIASAEYDEEERNLRLRKVPLLYWANFPMKELGTDAISMNYVVPTLLDLAGIELGPYYDYLLRMKDSVPITSSYGRYYDKEGNLFYYSDDENAPYERLVDNYFYLEYHNLQSDRDQKLYMPYSQ